VGPRDFEVTEIFVSTHELTAEAAAASIVREWYSETTRLLDLTTAIYHTLFLPRLTVCAAICEARHTELPGPCAKNSTVDRAERQ
jgi:hypothetical protein